MNIENEQVCHRKFGLGIVTEQAETTVTVKFSEQDDVKKFHYPAAFDLFMKLCDPAKQEKLDEALRLIREQTEAVKRQQEAEREKRRQEEPRTKPAAVKKRASGKKKSTSKLKKAQDGEDDETMN